MHQPRPPCPQPRKTRLAVEGLADPIKALNNAELYDDWEESFVLLHCHQRLKPARMHGRLMRMKMRYAQQGQQTQFDAFFTRVKEALHPDFITPHGCNRTFAEMTDNDIFAKLDVQLAPVIKLGHPVILYAGALLGLVREGRLIDYDDDVDFAIHLGESTIDEMPKKWLEFKRKLVGNGSLSARSITSKPPIFKVESNLGIDIDLFPAWTENGRFSVYPYALNDLPQSDIFPLKALNEGKITLPQNAEALVAQSYGENWQTPDPLFHFNWHRAHRRFGPLLQQGFSLVDTPQNSD